jgi:type I restriction enzyme, R subunit
MIKEIKENEPLTDDDITGDLTAEIIDQETGEKINFEQNHEILENTKPTIIDAGEITTEKQTKVYIAGVDVTILNERIQYLNDAGDLVTTSLKDYTKQNLLQEFSSLDDFLTRWNQADKKTALIAELRNHAIIVEDLEKDIQKDLDLFDLICHIAWDCPPLTRKERAEKFKLWKLCRLIIL